MPHQASPEDSDFASEDCKDKEEQEAGNSGDPQSAAQSQDMISYKMEGIEYPKRPVCRQVTGRYARCEDSIVCELHIEAIKLSFATPASTILGLKTLAVSTVREGLRTLTVETYHGSGSGPGAAIDGSWFLKAGAGPGAPLGPIEGAISS